ncbi:PP2C family protein-serine/threonine phosphatase [Aquifex aeolicus]|uniref:PPM-type phosphatase domain-containing protein n=1 Tax=Aquifex aeolicus (strain VF5) TaxID=224324 RepID=O67075_AQUAE|nr:PP2C family serine/threonine-protein phosphatase [Aquifex aeolicus]AAC07040.1 hypothetical protein aq_933 [Aquifex aeolicus VF5]
MKVRTAYITNTGKVRPKNEDALLVDGKLFRETSMNTPQVEEFEVYEFTPFAVADGLGGHACGEKASGLVLEVLKEEKPEKPEYIKEIILKAKKRLDEYINEGNEFCYGFGTALAGVYLSKDRAIVFNVGDCRVYRFRDGNLELLTEDHTYLFQYYKEGRISYEELRLHPERHILESAILGGYPDLPEVFVREEEVKKGDTFLICSDGLWEALSFREKVSCLSKEDIKLRANCLFELAYQDGKDNISFILLECD